MALCLFICLSCQLDLCVYANVAGCVRLCVCVCGVRVHAYEAFVSNWNVPSGKLAGGASVIL